MVFDKGYCIWVSMQQITNALAVQNNPLEIQSFLNRKVGEPLIMDFPC